MQIFVDQQCNKLYNIHVMFAFHVFIFIVCISYAKERESVRV